MNNKNLKNEYSVKLFSQNILTSIFRNSGKAPIIGQNKTDQKYKNINEKYRRLTSITKL